MSEDEAANDTPTYKNLLNPLKTNEDAERTSAATKMWFDQSVFEGVDLEAMTAGLQSDESDEEIAASDEEEEPVQDLTVLNEPEAEVASDVCILQKQFEQNIINSLG